MKRINLKLKKFINFFLLTFLPKSTAAEETLRSMRKKRFLGGYKRLNERYSVITMQHFLSPNKELKTLFFISLETTHKCINFYVSTQIPFRLCCESRRHVLISRDYKITSRSCMLTYFPDYLQLNETLWQSDAMKFLKLLSPAFYWSIN